MENNESGDAKDMYGKGVPLQEHSKDHHDCAYCHIDRLEEEEAH